MDRSLLLVGASTYAVVASAVVTDMRCFETQTSLMTSEKLLRGIEVIGTKQDIDKLAIKYSNIVVVIGNPVVRL